MQIQQYSGNMEKTVDGFQVEQTHGGQKKAYGDTFYEYTVTSDKDTKEVEQFCRDKLHKAIPYDEWLRDYRDKGCSMEMAFRAHYKFHKTDENKYFYQVISLYTD